MALFNQLKLMIKEERAAATRDALAVPEEASFDCTFNPPKIGQVTAEREEHERVASQRMARMVEKKDNAELVALDKKFPSGLRIFDPDLTVKGDFHELDCIVCGDNGFEAKCVKLYPFGHDQAMQRMRRVRESYFRLDNATMELSCYGGRTWLEDFERMIGLYTEKAEVAMRKRKTLTRGGGGKRKKSR